MTKQTQNSEERVYEGVLEDEEEQQGKKILYAVETILDSNQNIRKRAQKALERYAKLEPRKQRDKAAARIIAYYSNLSASSGVVTTLPSLVPGIGALFTIFGGGIMDAVMVLKCEVEMALCLASLYGYDIEEDAERTRAFLMTSAALEGTKASESRSESLLRVVDLAVNEYSTRQLSKMMLKIIGRAGLTMSSKRLLRLMPVVGMAVGGGVNKVLTQRTGKRCKYALDVRRANDDAKEAKEAK
ncbi:MAG: EcsC family protein [Bradymonadales bacterium]|jgi:hypothetical protein